MTRTSYAPLPPLGALERLALAYLWSAGEAEVAQVHTAIGIPRGITANTVGSTLERLWRKGLVSRQKVSHAYRYAPALDRHTFVLRQLVDSVGGPQALASRGVLAAFLDAVAEVDHAALDALEQLIAQKREEQPP
jgi:predicted transcriptional regulator